MIFGVILWSMIFGVILWLPLAPFLLSIITSALRLESLHLAVCASEIAWIDHIPSPIDHIPSPIDHNPITD